MDSCNQQSNALPTTNFAETVNGFDTWYTMCVQHTVPPDTLCGQQSGQDHKVLARFFDYYQVRCSKRMA